MNFGGNRIFRLPMPVWDLPTRLFHWALVLLMITSYVTMRANAMALHMLSGYAILTLLLFRIAWGFLGSETARFASFLAGPRAVLRHLARLTRREPDEEVGHNAAGGWAVIVLLAVVGVQVCTGLCATGDEGAVEGPFAPLVGSATSDWLTGIHARNFTLILVVAAAHVVAIAVYGVVKRHNLIVPMITGRKRLPATMPAPRMVSSAVAAIVLVAVAAVVTLVVTVL